MTRFKRRPPCAEVDSYIANLDLFEKYNIPVPTNYAEFVDTINRFEDVGIKGFSTDWHADYTCLETMQGNSIPQLMSLEGTTWRREYESETVDGQVGLDDNAVYKVLLPGEDNYIEYKLFCNCPMPEDLKAKRAEQYVGDYNSYDCMFDSVNACGQLLAPTDYVTILR